MQIEQIIDRGMAFQKPLCLLDRFESRMPRSRARVGWFESSVRFKSFLSNSNNAFIFSALTLFFVLS